MNKEERIKAIREIGEMPTSHTLKIRRRIAELEKKNEELKKENTELKKGSPQWHDLRKDPNDLPSSYTTVLDKNGDKVEYIGEGKWQAYSEYYEKSVEVDPPDVWCEVPEYIEEKE